MLLKIKQQSISLGTAALILAALSSCSQQKKPDPNKKDTVPDAATEQVKLPAPYETKSVKNFSEVIGWQKGQMPTAPAGFKVSLFAGGLNNPRHIVIGPNGDVFASQATTEKKGIKKIGSAIVGQSKSQNMGESPNNIILLRDADGDGVAEQRFTFLSGLNKPFGMLILDNWFYVANTDGLYRYPYKAGETEIKAKGEFLTKLPAGGYNNHWTRNLVYNPTTKRIYISVGSGSNVAEHGIENEARRANILSVDVNGKDEKVFGSGLRNPVGMDFEPITKKLWTVVNERDGLGDDLVPDYLTSVKEGAFYGWPYYYYGNHEDPSVKEKKPELAGKVTTPDVALGSHTASLGLAFYNGNMFPEAYRGGAFIGQHGSWNRSVLSGYKVTFVPFKNGKPAGKMQDFLTGFLADSQSKKVHGRPVSLAVIKDGSLLVADDAGNSIWRVSK